MTKNRSDIRPYTENSQHLGKTGMEGGYQWTNERLRSAPVSQSEDEIGGQMWKQTHGL